MEVRHTPVTLENRGTRQEPTLTGRKTREHVGAGGHGEERRSKEEGKVKKKGKKRKGSEEERKGRKLKRKDRKKVKKKGKEKGERRKEEAISF